MILGESDDLEEFERRLDKLERLVVEADVELNRLVGITRRLEKLVKTLQAENARLQAENDRFKTSTKVI